VEETMLKDRRVTVRELCEMIPDVSKTCIDKMITKGVRFHQDNARPHIARVTTDLINKFGWDTVTHPPYSPDVAPRDYHLFPELKKHLGGTQFRTGEELTSRLGGRVLRFRHKEDGTPHAKMHLSQRRLCRKIGERLRFPKMYYSMPINMFFIVKNHWEPSFTDNPLTS
jgi:hypothetical protein